MILVFLSPPKPLETRTLTLTRTTMLATVPTSRHLPSTTCSHCYWATASGEHYTSMSLHSVEQQGDVALKAHVARVCFNCFRGMLQIFRMDALKIDRDVAYVVMVVHICYKRLFQMFHLLFHTYVAGVLIWMLHMFHTYVARVCSKCFSGFSLMLQ